MQEIWLHPNRRAIWFGSIPPLLLAALGLAVALQPGDARSAWWRWLAFAMIGLSALVLVTLMRQLVRPRIAYRNGQVLFYLRGGPPLAVPAAIVEAFFLGQGPTNLLGGGRQQTVNLVARLSQKEVDWSHRAVKCALGNWSDGYVTVRGTWCEPLNLEVVRRLNRRLKEAHTAPEDPAP